jgi:hypothetical protein
MLISPMWSIEKLPRTNPLIMYSLSIGNDGEIMGM